MFKGKFIHVLFIITAFIAGAAGNAFADFTDDIIYMYYGNSGATEPAEDSTYGSENVWDSNYKGVWHLNEASGTRNDSTSNDNHLTGTNTVGSAAGKIGTTNDFNNAGSAFHKEVSN